MIILPVLWRENWSKSTAVISSAIFTCLGRAGLVFSLDQCYLLLVRNGNIVTYCVISRVSNPVFTETKKPGNPEFFQNRKTGFWLPVNPVFRCEFWLTNVSLRDIYNSNSMQCLRFNVPFRLYTTGGPARQGPHSTRQSHSVDIALLLLTRSADMCIPAV